MGSGLQIYWKSKYLLRKKPLSFRTWFMYIWLPILFFLPIFAVGLVKFLMIQFPVTDQVTIQQENQMQLKETEDKILSDFDKWSDKNWQNNMLVQLEKVHLQIQLIDQTGSIIFTTVSEPRAFPNIERNNNYTTYSGPVVEHRIYRGPTMTGIAYFYQQRTAVQPEQSNSLLQEIYTFIIPVTWFLTSIILLMIQSWFMNRNVLNPLSTLEKAAQMVAKHELDFQLQQTNIREIREVTKAFDVMKQTLQSSIRRGAQIEQERKIFISSIIHDLRTPLFSIRGYLEGINEGIARTPEMINKYIKVCLNKSYALERLIADLFLYAKLDYLESEPEWKKISLVPFLSSLIEEFQFNASKKQIHIQSSIPETNISITADKHLLTRAINNILDNAIQHTPTNKTIELSCEISKEKIYIQIENEGPGIPPGKLPHVFTPLFRIEQSRNRQTGGAGLGLSIAKNIIQKHGGTITASNTSKGAIFTICIPINPSRKKVTD